MFTFLVMAVCISTVSLCEGEMEMSGDIIALWNPLALTSVPDVQLPSVESSHSIGQITHYLPIY